MDLAHRWEKFFPKIMFALTAKPRAGFRLLFGGVVRLDPGG
jgi:hypothetical protein